MMFLLPPETFPNLRPLFQAPHLSFVFEAMIAGNSPARLWADQPDTPRTAFIWDNAHCLYLAGDAANTAFNHALRQLLSDHILLEGKSRLLGIFKLITASAAWDTEVGRLLPHIPLTQRERILLTLANPIGTVAPLPDEFRLERITPELLASDLENAAALAAEIDSCWSSRERFFRHGIGYCAVRQQREIVGWCTTEYSSAGQCGIGIETIEAYTNRGIATQVGRAVISECVARQITPHWDSWTANRPSVAVAAKLGFQETLRYNVWLGRF